MAFNTVGQYSASHKAWDHVGNILPDIEVAEGIRSVGSMKPACWLPVQFYEKFYENWIVAMPGKVLCLDNDGRLVPAQYGLGSATITYTTSDVTAGTIDVRTGVTLLVGNVGTFNVSAVTSFMGRGLGALALSKPIGIASYPILQWAGDGSGDDDGYNPAALKQHNYSMQQGAAVLFDAMIQLPLMPATTASANLTRDSHVSQVQTFTALANLPVATNTMRTPITFANGTLTDSATRFVNQVTDSTEILAMGDWCINLTTGVIQCWADAPLAAGNIYTITYSHYASAPTGTSVSKFACVLGDVKPGDFLKANADSNLVVATAKTYADGVTDNFDTFADIIGQVVKIDVEPQDLLDRVRTAYDSLGTTGTGAYPGSAGQMDQMPGSATGGVGSLIHYAGAADKLVIVNLISR
jgi:hypothetical protein